ncbi:MAG: DUF896 domain-containing protein [Christensenellales bacterium]|jgi:uncharacterized protein YnzC (UPF0291/DUF896 family)
MLNEEQLARINFLARKSRTQGLTQAEKNEQTLLRAAYLAAVRSHMKNMLEMIRFAEDRDTEF